MRSLYVRILLAMAGTLSLSLVVFLAISRQIERNTFYRTFERTDELQLEEARQALDHGGPAAVSAYMQRANRIFGGSHYLLNSSGVDVVSGQDLSNLIPGAGAVEGRQRRAGKLVISRRTADGAYWFIALPPSAASSMGILSVLPAGHRSYRNSLLGCGGLDRIADPQFNGNGRAIRPRRALCPLAYPPPR